MPVTFPEAAALAIQDGSDPFEIYAEIARTGNPWPFIEWQWGQVLFAEDVMADPELPERLKADGERFLIIDNFQRELIDSVFDPTVREIFVKGNTGCGKGAASAIALCVYYSIYSDARIVITRDSNDTAVRICYGEVRDWWNKMIDPLKGIEVQAEGLINMKAREKHILFVANPRSGEGFSGVHGPRTLYWFDEACHDDQTEVLTDSGWKFFADVDTDDKLLTKDPGTNQAFYVQPRGLYRAHRKGVMFKYEARGIDFCITPDHRLFHTSRCGPWKLTPADQITTDQRMSRTFKWVGEDRSQHLIPAFCGPRKMFDARAVPMDEWLEFLGWFLSEGSFHRQSGVAYGIAITQSDESVLRKLYDYFESWGYKPRFNWKSTTPQVQVHERGLAEHLRRTCGEYCTSKRVPRYVGELPPPKIRILLDAYMHGDGYERKPQKENHSIRRILYTSSELLAGDLQELILKIGCRSSVTRRPLKGVKAKFKTHSAVSSRDGWVVSWAPETSLYYRPGNVRSVEYDGMVYCADVPPHHVLMTRRNGMCLWSGNTADVLGPRFDLANTQATKFLATANPRTVSGPFFRAFQLASDPDQTQTVRGPYGLRRLITADGEEMLNVRLQRLEHAVSPHGGITIEGTFYEAGEPIPRDVFETVKRIVPGQTGYDVHQGHKQNPDPNWVLCFAHGKFPPEDAELQVILSSWLKQPVEEWKEWRSIVQRAEKHQGSAALKLAQNYCPIQALGLDVGASRKGDPSILTLGGERGIACQLEYKTADAGELVAWIFRTSDRREINLKGGGIPVGIDSVGVGWGVASMLREQGVLVLEIKGNDTSEDPKRYANKRAEMYGEFGARVNPDGEYADQPFMLPDDEMLLAELVAPQKIFTASGEGMAYKITPKRKVPGLALKVETIEEKLGRSPDRGDSACYWWRAMQVRGVDLSEWLDAGAF